MARLVGPAVGGVLLGLAGLPAIILIDTASFAVAALLSALLRVGPEPAPRISLDRGTAWRSFWRELTEGLRVVRRDRPIAVLFAVVGFMTFGGTMLDPLYPAFGHDVLGGGPAVYGWLLTAMALGGLLGGLAIGQLGARVPPGRLVGWGSIAAGFLLLLQFNARWLPLVLAIAVVVGAPSAASRIGTQTLMQTRTADATRGRVLGLWGASSGLLSLAGASVGGGLAALVGVVTMLDVASGLTLLAGVVALIALSSPST